jgi:hypothetical protein
MKIVVVNYINIFSSFSIILHPPSSSIFIFLFSILSTSFTNAYLSSAVSIVRLGGGV